MEPRRVTSCDIIKYNNNIIKYNNNNIKYNNNIIKYNLKTKSLI